jgi:hypothetical protein
MTQTITLSISTCRSPRAAPVGSAQNVKTAITVAPNAVGMIAPETNSARPAQPTGTCLRRSTDHRFTLT